MRDRYFSPEPVLFSTNLTINSSKHRRLNWAGSTNNLQTTTSTLLSDSERKIGAYTYDIAQ